MTATADRTAAWRQLAAPTPPVGVFWPEEIADLPAPAQRLLTRALIPDIELTPTVLLEMEGDIKLKRWMPFRARQILRAGTGFVWEAAVGKPPISFSGGDSYWQGRGTLDFRLWGILPVARAAGPDIDRSAAGRLAAETVAWAPQALTPQMGAAWAPIDSTTAVVTLPIGDDTVDVAVTVDQTGRLRELAMQRWGDADHVSFDLYPFGGSVDNHDAFGGITIAAAGRVGWRWGTQRQAEGEFFHYRITHGHLPATTHAKRPWPDR